MEKAGKRTPHNIKNRGEPTQLDFDESTAKVEVNSELQEPTTKVAGINRSGHRLSQSSGNFG